MTGWRKGTHKLFLASILAVLLAWPAIADRTFPPAPDPRWTADSVVSNDFASSAAAVVADATPPPSPSAWSTPTATLRPPANNYIWVPWRSQFDGTLYQSGNCGPASLAMAMSYFGEWWSTDGIRKSTIEVSGAVAYDEGTDWTSLKYAAEKRSFKVIGLYDAAGAYRKWTINDLVRHIEQRHPLLLLVRQRLLPGHGNTTYAGEHYIVFLGLMADGRVVYHDSDFFDETDGSYRLMSQEMLLRAWGDTSVGLVNTAMALAWDGSSRKWDASAAAGSELANSRWRSIPLR